MSGPHHVHGERAELAVCGVLEDEDIAKIALRPAEGPGDARTLGERRDQRDRRRHPTVGMMSPHVCQRYEIEPVIAMQVTEKDRIDIARVEVLLEFTERTVAKVDQ